MGPRELGDLARFLFSEVAIAKPSAHRVRECGPIVGRHHTAAREPIPLAGAVAPGDDGGGSGQRGLEGNQAKSFPHRGMHQDVGAGIVLGKFVARAHAAEGDSRRHGGEKALECRTQRSHEHELRFGDPGEELNEKVAALLGTIASHEEKARPISRSGLRRR